MGITPSAWQRGVDSAIRKGATEAPQGQQRMFLLRLRRLIWLRRSCAGQLDDIILKMLDRCIYSTYCDCLELGIGDEARRLLRQAA